MILQFLDVAEGCCFVLYVTEPDTNDPLRFCLFRTPECGGGMNNYDCISIPN